MVLLLLFSCEPAAPRPGAPPPMTDFEPSAAQQVCKTDDECVAVELGCCNHCNSGRVVAVNRKSVATAEANKQGPCDDFVCTRKMCRPSTASCDGGTCRLK